MFCFPNVTCCTESESADRPEDEIYRSTGQEERRDQQELRTFRDETVRHPSPNYGKANDLKNDQYTGRPKGHFTELLLHISYILSPDFIYLSTTLTILWTRYPLFLSISVATHCYLLLVVLDNVVFA
jgi:hypothetical protein